MIGCFSLARETFDIDFAKKKLLKTKKSLTKLNKKIIFFDDLITNDTNEETMITPAKEINKEFLEGDYDNLLKRKINEDTCKFFNYQIGKDKGKPVHIANYYDNNHARCVRAIPGFFGVLKNPF